MKENKTGQIQFEFKDFYEKITHPLSSMEYVYDDITKNGHWKNILICTCGKELISNQSFCDFCNSKIDWNEFYEDNRY